MKHICSLTRSVFLLLVFFSLISLAACRTMRVSEKAVSKSETASVTESRLTFYRTLDSLSRVLALSADSVSIICYDPIMPESQSAVPSEIASRLETPSNQSSNSRPQKYKPPSYKKINVYGLHLNASTEKKSVATTDLKDSVNKFTQSQKIKSATKQSSTPSNAPKYVFYILIILTALWALHKLRS